MCLDSHLMPDFNRTNPTNLSGAVLRLRLYSIRGVRVRIISSKIQPKPFSRPSFVTPATIISSLVSFHLPLLSVL